MNKQIVKSIVVVCVIVMSELNANGDTKALTSYDPALTNAVTAFINAVEDDGFLLRPSSLSYRGDTEKKDGTAETVYGVNLFFERNKNSGIAVVIHYSKTDFSAAKNLTKLIKATSSSGRLAPTNSTYRTDFTVLSYNDSGSVTRNASVLLLSSEMAVDIRVGSDTDDISQVLLQVISKIEMLRKALQRPPQKE